MVSFEVVRNLNLPTEQFAIFGSGPLGVRNIRESGDIDLIVKVALWEKLKKKYPLSPKRSDSIVIGDIEIYYAWPPFQDVNVIIDSADIINELPFVRLEYVIEWKKYLGREKDKKDIRLIQEFLTKP